MTVSLLAVFFVIGGTHFLYHYQKPSGSSPSNTSTVSELTKAGTVNEASVNGSNISSSSIYSNWNTFSSSKKYSLKYPNGWFDARDNNIKQSSSDEMFFSNENVTLPKVPSSNGIQVHSSYISASGFPDIDRTAFASSVGKFNISGMYDTSIIFTKIANLKLLGFPAVEYTIDSSVNNSQLNYTLQYDINKNGNLNYISFLMNKNQLSMVVPKVKTVFGRK